MAKLVEVTSKTLQFELMCNPLESDKAELLAIFAHMGKTIKKLKVEVKSAISAYQESEDFMKVKVHNFLKGFWHGETEAQVNYPN